MLTPAAVVVIAYYDLQSAVIVRGGAAAGPAIHGADRAGHRATDPPRRWRAMTTLQSRLLDLVAGIPTLRALGRADGPAGRIAELGAAHRRSTMATLRIAFLSALVLELLATLGVALVAVSVGLRLVFGEIDACRRPYGAAARAGGVLAAAARRRRVPRRRGRKGRRRQGLRPARPAPPSGPRIAHC